MKATTVMSSSNFEHLFTECSLELSIPDTSVDFPGTDNIDDWIKDTQRENAERKEAFFGEQYSNRHLRT